MILDMCDDIQIVRPRRTNSMLLLLRATASVCANFLSILQEKPTFSILHTNFYKTPTSVCLFYHIFYLNNHFLTFFIISHWSHHLTKLSKISLTLSISLFFPFFLFLVSSLFLFLLLLTSSASSSSSSHSHSHSSSFSFSIWVWLWPVILGLQFWADFSTMWMVILGLSIDYCCYCCYFFFFNTLLFYYFCIFFFFFCNLGLIIYMGLIYI